jgi:zinc protease
VIYDFPADFYDQYRANVRAVTAGQILDAAKRHLDPSRMQVVVVGEPDAIAGPLERLGVGPVATYDDNGRPF